MSEQFNFDRTNVKCWDATRGHDLINFGRMGHNECPVDIGLYVWVTVTVKRKIMTFKGDDLCCLVGVCITVSFNSHGADYRLAKATLFHWLLYGAMRLKPTKKLVLCTATVHRNVSHVNSKSQLGPQ